MRIFPPTTEADRDWVWTGDREERFTLPRRVEKLVGEHPAVACSLALIGGLIVGWALKQQ